MLPGAVGSRWMPRKMAGIEMITIEASIVAIVMLSVVFDSAIHLYLSPGAGPVLARGGRPPESPESALAPATAMCPMQ